MNKEILLKMLFKAKESTEKGLIVWKTTSEEDEFKVNFEKSSIVVWSQYQKDKKVYGFLVFNHFGTIVGRIVSSEDGYENELKELYEIIYSKVFAIDETISDVFEGLDGKSINKSESNTGFNTFDSIT